MSTVFDVLRSGRAALDEAGVDTPRVDTELLLAHVLGCGRSRLLTAPGVSEDQATEFRALVSRRAAGEPVQHLTGTAPFRHLDLAVGPGVFVPRPETELILEIAAGALAEAGLVVDLCAGSGAIALAVAQEYPAGTVLAVERSPDALTWLRRNAAGRVAAGDRPIEIVAGDVTRPELLAERNTTADVVLSNPPYVPESVRAVLGREVFHDPAEAVFSGKDGLDLMPELLATAARLLRPGGLVVIEHDDTQGESVPRLLRSAGGWLQVTEHRDLTGRDRFVSAVRAD